MAQADPVVFVKRKGRIARIVSGKYAQMPRWFVVQPGEIVTARHRNDRSGAREHGNAVERCGDDDLTSRLMIGAGVEVVPTVAPAREVRASLARPGLNDAGQEEIGTEHEFFTVRERAGIVH